MAYCTSCGIEVESSDRFCRHCGAVAAETRQASSDAESGMREVATNGTSDSEPASRGPSAQVGADESSLADGKQQRVSVSESDSEPDGTSPRTRSRAKSVFVAIVACVVVAGAAGAVVLFTSRSQPNKFHNSAASLSPAQRKVESCVTSIGVPAEEAINDLENFDESAMTTVMAGFSATHGTAEYAVLQSVVSDVSQNLMSAPWASSWKSAIKHELPTIESFCNKRYSISSASTSTTVTPGTSSHPCFGFSGNEWDSLARSLIPVIGLDGVRYVSSSPAADCITTLAFKRDPNNPSWASWWIISSKDPNYPSGGGLSREVGGHWIVEAGPQTYFCPPQLHIPASVQNWFFPCSKSSPSSPAMIG